MLDIRAPIRFFMGADTSGGFVGFPDDFYQVKEGWRAYLLKGGPGQGKSQLMRRVWEWVEEREQEQEAEAVVCAWNPDSLDGVVMPGMRVCILDADAPHAREPLCWGGVEQLIDLSACLNIPSLQEQRQEIIEELSTYQAMRTRCRKFKGAAASLLSDSCRIAAECTDFEKIRRNAARIAAREFGAHSDNPGQEKRRFLSGITPEGVVTFYDTLQTLCPRIFSIEDEQGAASRVLLDELRNRALSAGHTVYTCICPLFSQNKPDHLLIPSLGIGFTTSNQWHKADFPVFRRIHAARFTDAERLRSRRQLLSFNRRAARELINEAVQLTEEAGQVWRRIEEIYDAATDTRKREEMAERLIQELEKDENLYQ